MPNAHVPAAAEGLPDPFDDFDAPAPLDDLVHLISPPSDAPDSQLISYAATLHYLVNELKEPTSSASHDTNYDRASEIVRRMSNHQATTSLGLAAKGFAAAWRLIEFKRDGTPYVYTELSGDRLLASLYEDGLTMGRMGE